MKLYLGNYVALKELTFLFCGLLDLITIEFISNLIFIKIIFLDLTFLLLKNVRIV